MPGIVMKFGGTSVGSAERIRAVAELVRRELPRGPVVVVSAMAGVTDRLLALAALAADGNDLEVGSALQGLERLHLDTCEGLLEGSPRAACETHLHGLFDALRDVVGEATFLRDSSAETQDAIASFGERLASVLVAARMASAGLDAVLLDSRRLVKTDSNFGAANLLEPETEALISKQVEPAAGRVAVVQGYIGSTVDGVTTTLGRGGSDYSGAIFGAALGCEEVQIWTDVSGVMSCDPQLVPGARTISRLSYDEAVSLATLGGKVLHPMTMRPALGRGVRISIRNTLLPDGPLTTVSTSGVGTGPIAVTVKKGLLLLTLRPIGERAWSEFLSSTFLTFEQYGLSVVSTEVAGKQLSVVVENSPWYEDCLHALRGVASTRTTRDISLVAVIGSEAWRAMPTWERSLASLQRFGTDVFSCSVSRSSVVFVVNSGVVSGVARHLHESLFDNAHD